MLPAVALGPLHYRGQESIAINCTLTKDLELVIRKLKGVKWCGEKRCWYLPLSRENYLTIKEVLKDIAVLNIESLRKYLEQKKAVQPLLKNEAVTKPRARLMIEFPLSKENMEAFKKYHSLLLQKPIATGP